MVKEYGEAEIESVQWGKAGQLFAANIRSNDLAFRYGTRLRVAIILGDTARKEATQGGGEAAQDHF
jgi:hypothetical protein